MKKIIWLAIITAFFLFACKKPFIYSDIPEIKFISFEKYKDFITINDTLIPEEVNGGILTFYFQDGKGDIGLNGNDTFPPFDGKSPFHHNFICEYYEKQNGDYVKIDSIEDKDKMIPYNFNARIPRLSYLPEESINGEITLNMISYYRTSIYDSIKLEFYILDRKLNKSNLLELFTTKGKD